MRRFHVHESVRDLQHGIRFCPTLFGAEPSIVKDDYARWMLEDPRADIAVSKRASATGVEHLGLQVDSGYKLNALEDRLRRADASMLAAANTICSCAKSDGYWVTDPQGVDGESFHTPGRGLVVGEAARAAPAGSAPGCGSMDSAIPMPRPKSAKPPAPCRG